MSMKTYLAQHSFSQTRVFNRNFYDGGNGRRLSARVARRNAGRCTDRCGDGPVKIRRRIPRTIRLAKNRFAGGIPGGGLQTYSFCLRAGSRRLSVCARSGSAGYSAESAILGAATSDFSIIRFEPGEITAGAIGGSATRASAARESAVAGACRYWHRGRFVSITGSWNNAIAPLLGKGDTYKSVG